MKTLKLIFILLSLSTATYAQQWSEFELNIGAQAVQGEMADGLPLTENFNPFWSFQFHTRPAKSNRFSFGGSVSGYSMNMSYEGQKDWLDGAITTGYDLNAMLNMRLLLTGRDDFRFLNRAFFTYFEAGAGVHYMRYRTNFSLPTDEVPSHPPTVPTADPMDKVNTEYAPSIGAALGFQYYITHNWGVSFRLEGQYVFSDNLDGVTGITDTKDYFQSASLGVIYGF